MHAQKYEISTENHTACSTCALLLCGVFVGCFFLEGGRGGANPFHQQD